MLRCDFLLNATRARQIKNCSNVWNASQTTTITTESKCQIDRSAEFRNSVPILLLLTVKCLLRDFIRAKLPRTADLNQLSAAHRTQSIVWRFRTTSCRFCDLALTQALSSFHRTRQGERHTLSSCGSTGSESWRLRQREGGSGNSRVLLSTTRLPSFSQPSGPSPLSLDCLTF